MTFLRFSLLLLLAALGASAETAPVVEILGPRIEARDLAALPGWEPTAPDTDLGPSPLPGRPRRIPASLLGRWAAASGAAPVDLPPSVLLERALLDSSPATIEAIVRSVVAAQYDLLPESVEVSVQVGPARFTAPAGPLEWSILGRPPSGPAPALLRLRWRDSAGRSGVEAVEASVQAHGAWLEAARDLPLHEVLRPEDLVAKQGLLPILDISYLTHLPIDGDYHLRLPMKAGEALRADAIELRPDVMLGDILELQVRAGAVVLRTPARAEGEGRIGQTVPLRNLESGRRVVARILSDKSAEAVVR
ncbi:MAG: hypothetical protein GC160_28735 [Acidobacteria bacterium]|nr:hypothetical protein [Acidobacteriota bacterium]